jgi:hypothetical protein
MERDVRCEQRGKNNQLAAAQKIAMKIGRRLRARRLRPAPFLTFLLLWSLAVSVKMEREAPPSHLADGPILIATNQNSFPRDIETADFP